MPEMIYWPSFYFYFFSLIACAFALAVVASNNIVHMALYLVLSLAATAGLFFLAGADFVAAMQLLIYVGGTLVLLVFGVMLTSRSQFISMKTRRGEWGITLVVGACLFSVLAWAAFSVPEWRGLDRATAEAVSAENTATPLAMGLLGIRVDRVPHGYLLVFEIISVHLLVVLIGAAYLARAKRKRISAVAEAGAPR